MRTQMYSKLIFGKKTENDLGKWVESSIYAIGTTGYQPARNNKQDSHHSSYTKVNLKQMNFASRNNQIVAEKHRKQSATYRH